MNILHVQVISSNSIRNWVISQFLKCRKSKTITVIHVPSHTNEMTLFWSSVNWRNIFKTIYAGLQIAIDHRTMDDQNLPMSDEITTLAGHLVRPIFCCNILTISLTKNIWLSYTLLFPMYLCVYVRLNFPFVRPKWCPSRTHVLSR